MKIVNRQNSLKFKDIIDSEIYASYYFSSEIGIIDLRNSKFRDEHNVKEHLLILSLNDINENILIRMLFGWLTDFDLIMVNQVLFTFNRHGGYLYRNDTQETWYWEASHHSVYRPSIKFDYQENTMKWLTIAIFSKFGLILAAIIAYGHISLINGLLIRVAILCSNISIFPLVTCARSILRT